MRKMLLGFGFSLCLLPFAVEAQKLVDYPEWQYANVLYEGVFTCKLKSDNSRAATNLGSAHQDRARSEYMQCHKEFSEKAQEGLPKAVKAARTESVKTAIKDLYTAWGVYFDNLSGPGSAVAKNSYETARNRLKTELIAQ
ncbi:hypothetical protein HGO40_11365 [Pseudomonas sp. CG7]|uniref:hypothetical protein n=1 Tax=Pseudomonas sp. CG7 TaxID=191007 RepID=UPI0020341409|nr:hypothetical protein [Pseudomonas sp. CG7]MCM2461079.1 hypothetical protein [Pseudomonas sp. CG7]